jgi:hypothetical protein
LSFGILKFGVVRSSEEEEELGSQDEKEEEEEFRWIWRAKLTNVEALRSMFLLTDVLIASEI